MLSRTLLMMTALLGSLALLEGCGSVTLESTLKSTKSLYRQYLNTPASIDYTDKGSLSDAENMLATRMVGIDIQLEQLERYLQNADRPPTGESVAILFQRFPWLSGLAAVDASGVVVGQEPPSSLKPLDFSKILEQEPRGGELRGIRGYVEDTPMGPEVFAGVPIYNNMDLAGVLITHFDMRSLLAYTSGAEDLVVLSPGTVLWPGRFEFESTPLVNRDWENITRSSIKGTVSNSNGEFIWIVRFIGKQPLVFAAPVKGTFIEKREQLDALSHPSAFGLRGGPVTESQVLESPDSSLLLAPLPPVRELEMHEQPISQ